MCGSREEIFLQAGGFFTRLHPHGLVNESAALQDYGGLVRQEFYQLKILVHEDRGVGRINSQRPQLLVTCCDRSGQKSLRSFRISRLIVQWVVPADVGVEDGFLCNESPAGGQL